MDKLVLQARAAREFGVPWEVFDFLTPAQLEAIAKDAQKRWLIEQKQADRRTARIIVAIYRLHGAKGAKEEHFLPQYVEEKPTETDPEKEGEIYRERLRQTLMGITKAAEQKYGR